MPDLTIIYVQACATTTLTKKVESSKGGKFYDVHASLEERGEKCTCPGFGFRGHCRHIAEVRGQICGWNEQDSDEVQTPQQEMEAVCPRCGGETMVLKVGV
jgi:uncharacterized Zn finger protein